MKIPRPPRGICKSCGHYVAIRGDGKIRQHARINGFGLSRAFRKPCPGGGMEPQ